MPAAAVKVQGAKKDGQTNPLYIKPEKAARNFSGAAFLLGVVKNKVVTSPHISLVEQLIFQDL